MRVCGPRLCICVLEPACQLLLFFASGACCCCGCCCCSFIYVSNQHVVFITPSLKLSSSVLWQPRYNSSRKIRFSFCDGHGRCISLCVRVRVMFPMLTNTCMISREVAGRCEGSRAIQTHTFFLGVTTAAAVQQQYNSSTTAPALQTLAFVTATVLSCSTYVDVCSVHHERYVVYVHSNHYMHRIFMYGQMPKTGTYITRHERCFFFGH